MFVVIEKISKFKRLIKPVVIYQILVNSLGLFLIYKVSSQWSLNLIWLYCLWTLFSIITEIKPVVMPSNDQLTVSFAIHISSLILFGAPTSILISTVSNIIVDVVRKRGIKKLIFNVSQYAITIYISWLTLVFLSPDNTVIHYKGHWPAMIVSSAVYVILNTILVSTVISLSEGRRPLRFLTRAINLEMLHFTLLVPVSLLIVILYTVEPMAIVILVLPLVLAHFSFDNYITLWTETRTTIEVLADIVDKKDPYTSKHSHMVADYCNDIAERIPLRPDDVETLVSAAKVHDLGKISVPDSILLKEGSLTNEEREVMITHSFVGYDILSKLRFYKIGARLVLYHHERFDGNGYPAGLKGESIPLGARILAVADCYHAMTSDRPYRKAMSSEEAINELTRCAGTQFDPEIVEVFIQLLKKKNM